MLGGMISQELLLLAPPGTFAAVVFISTHPGRTLPPVRSGSRITSKSKLNFDLLQLRTIWTFASSLLLPGKKSPEEYHEQYLKLVFALVCAPGSVNIGGFCSSATFPF